MELECVKYHEKMDSEQAVCRHPDDYCRHRQSCMIHFIGQENKRQAAKNAEPAQQGKQGEQNNGGA